MALYINGVIDVSRYSTGNISIKGTSQNGNVINANREALNAFPRKNEIMAGIDAMIEFLSTQMTEEERLMYELERQKQAEQFAKEQALAEKQAAEAEAAQKEQERAEAVAELLALSEMLYGEGTDTPLPEVPEPGATP